MEVINNGEAIDMSGIKINIADVLGEKIVNQWMATLTEDDMKLIFDSLTNLAFYTRTEWEGDKKKEIKVSFKKIEEKTDSSSYSWGRKEEPTTLWRYAQNLFIEKFSAIIQNEVERILETDEYKEKAIGIANNIVDYALNGYKEDMTKRIRERLVSNVVDQYPSYNEINLKALISQTIDEKLRYN